MHNHNLHNFLILYYITCLIAINKLTVRFIKVDFAKPVS